MSESIKSKAPRGKASKKDKPNQTTPKLDQLEVMKRACELGFMHVNDKEKRLIELLRFTTYHGRNIVIDTAIAMRRIHPWSDGQMAMESNTQTTYPDDGRYFYPMGD
jgi:hypothetical protein